MMTGHDYELLDFGNERKLERFGPLVLDRPAPAAINRQERPELWKTADAKFDLSSNTKSGPQRGEWNLGSDIPTSWTICFDELQFELKRTDFGHIGIFPEQAKNWQWICEALRGCSEPIKVLNLFAYTGGSTIAAATKNASVTHVDAAANVVAWARRNAELSNLSHAPIRWITEDALKFAQRELKRNRQYDAVILDPPSYGHGPGGEVWKIDQHLPELLQVCRELTGPQPKFLLLTCHAAGYDGLRLKDCLKDAGFDGHTSSTEFGDLWLTMADGRQLHSGTFARIRTSH